MFDQHLCPHQDGFLEEVTIFDFPKWDLQRWYIIRNLEEQVDLVKYFSCHVRIELTAKILMNKEKLQEGEIGFGVSLFSRFDLEIVLIWGRN